MNFSMVYYIMKMNKNETIISPDVLGLKYNSVMPKDSPFKSSLSYLCQTFSPSISHPISDRWTDKLF